MFRRVLARRDRRSRDSDDPRADLFVAAKPDMTGAMDDGTGYTPLPGDSIHSAMVADSDEPFNEKNSALRDDRDGDGSQGLVEADSRATLASRDQRSTMVF
mmetsp:Transcript_23882/g.42538  ORF Transcript_23882/g.42538 Transcript_23882/m.42538 type:complete len:101 (+) Transcript_23882:821-1123(+)